jgi:hypothetical protein
MASAIKFKNFSQEDFTCKYDGMAYTFKAGQEMYIEDFKAEHFAKHLVDREMNRTNTPTNLMTPRKALEAQCFPSEEVVSEEVAIDIEARKAVKAPKKIESEFEDLKIIPKVKIK